VPSAALRHRIGALEVVRDLPWRRTRDPWLVLVAEVCLQQTQAARAIEAYRRCAERFSSPEECASAPRSAVLEAWAGLGYYRRARALHEAAGVIVARHGGVVPDRLEDLLALPGVGPYTARAVLAFAFERDVAVVDTNVARVLARAVANRALQPREAQSLADDLVVPGTGWKHNQAMLDLGALHCSATPRCAGCPLRPACRWRRAGPGAPDPAPRSAGVSRPQPRFEGSDRQGRGRLLAAATAGPVRLGDVARAAGWPEDPHRANLVASALVDEGLLRRDGGALRLEDRVSGVFSPRGIPGRARRPTLAARPARSGPRRGS